MQFVVPNADVVLKVGIGATISADDFAHGEIGSLNAPEQVLIDLNIETRWNRAYYSLNGILSPRNFTTQQYVETPRGTSINILYLLRLVKTKTDEGVLGIIADWLEENHPEAGKHFRNSFGLNDE